MTNCILLALFFCSISGLKAQDTDSLIKKHQIRTGTGFSRYIIQDDVMSPMVYKGSTAPIWLEYKEIKTDFIECYSAFFGKSDLKSDIPDDFSKHHSEIITGYFGCSVLRKAYTSKTRKPDIYAGGKLESFIKYSKHYYTNDLNESAFDFNTSLGLQLSITKRIDKVIDGISYSFNMPVVTFASRPERYNIKVTEQYYGFVFPDRLFEFQSELSIYKSISRNMAVGVSNFIHYYSFKKHPDNRPAKYLNNQVVTGVIFTF